MKKIILTVCKGNIHRSVIAAACIDKLLRIQKIQSAIEVRSRGLLGSFGTAPPRAPSIREYPAEWALTRPGLEALGIEIPIHQTATPITRADVESASLILALDRSVMQTLLNHFDDEVPDLHSKMMLFMQLGGVSADVPEPDGKRDPAIFNEVITIIHSTTEGSLSELLRLVNRS